MECLKIAIPKDLEELREMAKHGKKRQGDFILKCGHKNGYQMPIYPFEWICVECGQKHLSVFQEVKI